MPPKHVLKRLDKFDAFFLESRRAGLQRFLQRISHHPILSLDKSFTYVAICGNVYIVVVVTVVLAR